MLSGLFMPTAEAQKAFPKRRTVACLREYPPGSFRITGRARDEPGASSYALLARYHSYKADVKSEKSSLAAVGRRVRNALDSPLT